MQSRALEGWPKSLDDLRTEPGRLIDFAGLERLGIVTSRRHLRHLPPPRRLPAGPAWESRAILQAFDLQAPPVAHRASASTWSAGQPYPQWADLKTTAAIITDKYGPVSHRTLERWPLVGRRFNGRKVFFVVEALKVAEDRFAMSPPRKTA